MTFDPSTVGAKSGTLSVTSNADAISVALSGTGTQTELTATPDSLSFGSKDVDDGATDGADVGHREHRDRAVTFTGITVDSGWTRLTGDASDCATTETLAVGEECDLRIAFDPSATGAQTGDATIASNAPDESVTLSGNGIETELSAAPDPLSFGPQDVDEAATAALSSTVTNSGTETVTLASVTIGGTNAADFALVSGANECVTGTVLTDGQACIVRAAFDPSAIGGRAATVTIDSNAPDETIGLSGTGTQTELTASPDSLAFGSHDVDEGATATQTSTITNTGTEPVDLDAVTLGGTDPSHFEHLTGQGTDCSATTVLPRARRASSAPASTRRRPERRPRRSPSTRMRRTRSSPCPARASRPRSRRRRTA